MASKHPPWLASSRIAPASTWLQRSALACTYPAAMATRLKPRLHPIGNVKSLSDGGRQGQLPMSASMRALSFMAAIDFWRRAGAMLRKEFLQLRRDRIKFGTMSTIPFIQLIVFGYAINATPRDLPTAVLLQESSDVGRSILAAIQNTKFFRVTDILRNNAEFDQAFASGRVLFAVEIPANFERALRRGDKPALLVAVDASDPVATGNAVAALSQLVNTALVNDHGLPDSGPAAVRNTHASTLQSSSRDGAQYRAWPPRHHPDVDDADLHRAFGDA